MLDCGQQGGGQAQRVKPPSNRQPVCRLVWSAVSGLQMVQRWTSVTTSVSLSVTDSSTELEHICPAAWTTAPPCLLFIHRSLSPGTESVPEVDLSLTGRLTQRENSSVHAVASPEGFFTVCVYEEVNNGCARLLPWRWRPSRSAWTLNWRPPERRDGRRSSHRRSCWAAETEWKADKVIMRWVTMKKKLSDRPEWFLTSCWLTCSRSLGSDWRDLHSRSWTWNLSHLLSQFCLYFSEKQQKRLLCFTLFCSKGNSTKITHWSVFTGLRESITAICEKVVKVCCGSRGSYM